MKFLRKAALISLAVLLLTMPTAYALDAGDPDNMTEIEETYLAFEKALFKQLVEDGYVTQQDADAEITSLTNSLKASEEDFIYKLILQEGLPVSAPTMSKSEVEGILIKAYAELTGKSAKEIAKILEVENLTTVQLAQREGNLEALKNKLIEMKIAQMSKMVKEESHKQSGNTFSALKEKLLNMLGGKK